MVETEIRNPSTSQTYIGSDEVALSGDQDDHEQDDYQIKTSSYNLWSQHRALTQM